MKTKEAIERVRARFDKWALDEEDLAALRALGLADTESEDERIRKTLIHIVKGACDKYGIKYRGEEISEEKLLAYLEKQKDASKAIEAVDRIDKYIDGHVANAHDMQDSNPDKKYYQGRDDALGKIAGILQDVYSEEKQKEQQPAETFEIEHGKYYYCIKDYCSGGKKRTSRGDVVQALRGLSIMALGNRAREYFLPVNSIVPAEWDEEDETALGDLMWCIEQARKSAKNENDMGNIWFAENWVKKRIKSLRSQPHWKPSEEQMDVFIDALYYLPKNGFKDPNGCIESLYNDLKKL